MAVMKEMILVNTQVTQREDSESIFYNKSALLNASTYSLFYYCTTYLIIIMMSLQFLVSYIQTYTSKHFRRLQWWEGSSFFNKIFQ
jgi:hypothetical protein